MSKGTGTTERRKFKAHPKLLVDVIRRQAGTLSKSILELVMNSADSLLSVGKLRPDARCDVTVSNTEVRVVDNGRGFRSRREIEEHFEKFGQPHTEEENKTYGTFRMGRGQAFAHGRNVWRSGRFRMVVDVIKDGLDYHLDTDLSPLPGCDVVIDLYDPLDDYRRNCTVRDLELWVKYVPIPVYVNGKRLSRSVTEPDEPWESETDDGYVRVETNGSLGGLKLYNRGVFVQEIPSYRFGCGGEVVSKRALEVNFARNDVLSSCPVWKSLQTTVNDLMGKKTITAKHLTRAMIDSILSKAGAGQLPVKFADLKVLSDCNGKRYSFNTLTGVVAQHGGRLAFAKPGDAAADRCLMAGSCLVLDEHILVQLGVPENKFAAWAFKMTGLYGLEQLKVVPFEQVAQGFNESCHFVKEEDLTPEETVWLKLAEFARYTLGWARGNMANDSEVGRLNRHVYVGVSDRYNGWTDGETYIAINRAFLADLNFSVEGVVKLARLMAHELAHDERTDLTHHHGVEFYERFEGMCRESLGRFVASALRSLPSTVSRMFKGKKRLGVYATDRKQAEKAAAALRAAAEGILEVLPAVPE